MKNCSIRWLQFRSACNNEYITNKYGLAHAVANIKHYSSLQRFDVATYVNNNMKVSVLPTKDIPLSLIVLKYGDGIYYSD